MSLAAFFPNRTYQVLYIIDAEVVLHGSEMSITSKPGVNIIFFLDFADFSVVAFIA